MLQITTRVKAAFIRRSFFRFCYAKRSEKVKLPLNKRLVACLFRLIALRTSSNNLTCIACLFRLSYSCYMLSVPVTCADDGLHRTTFQPSSKYCLHSQFHLMARLPVIQVDSTVLPVSFLEQTPLDYRLCLVESNRTCVGTLNHEGPHCRVLQSCHPDPKFRVIP